MRSEIAHRQNFVKRNDAFYGIRGIFVDICTVLSIVLSIFSERDRVLDWVMTEAIEEYSENENQNGKMSEFFTYLKSPYLSGLYHVIRDLFNVVSENFTLIASTCPHRQTLMI